MFAWPAAGADRTAAYPNMAPVAEYMMPRDAEIALARSAAPASISGAAGIFVMGRQGYETVATSGNGFVCLVERAWMAGFDTPEFWNPKIRGPMCLNPAAVRTYLPQTLLRTRLALSGRSKAQIAAAVESAVARHELPAIEGGALCYMLSKDGYLADDGGHWHPHMMFFAPASDPVSWGAGLDGSPVLAAKDAYITIFMIPVRKWSDGTTDVPPEHQAH